MCPHLKQPQKSADSERIIALARETVGTPFHHQGRLCGIGIDCIGVLEHVAVGLGYHLVYRKNYGRIPTLGSLVRGLDQNLSRVDSPSIGDILLISFIDIPTHVGIYAGETIIHSYESVGRCVEHNYDKQWRDRTVRAYTWP